MVVTAKGTEALCWYVQILGEANAPVRRLRLRGLDLQREYELVETGERFGGDVLTFAGLLVPELTGDFVGVLWRFRAV